MLRKSLAVMISIFAANILFVIVMTLPFFRSMGVLFYRGIIFVVIISIILAIFLYCLRDKLFLDKKDILMTVVIFSSFTTLWFTHLPVTAERSVTVFLLNEMSIDKEKIYTEEELTGIFIEQYVLERKAVAKRMREQIVSGNVEVSDGGFQITQRGSALSLFFNYLNGIFANSNN